MLSIFLFIQTDEEAFSNSEHEKKSKEEIEVKPNRKVRLGHDHTKKTTEIPYPGKKKKEMRNTVALW